MFDEFLNTGKCDSCNTVTHLDEMVRKNYTKGLYHCVDCQSEKEVERYGFITPMQSHLDNNKIARLIQWCFG